MHFRLRRINNNHSGTSVPVTYAKNNRAHHITTGAWTGIALDGANDGSHVGGDLRSTSPSNHQCCWLSYWGSFHSDARFVFLQMSAIWLHREAVVISFETKTPRLSRTWWATSERMFQNRCRPDNAKAPSTCTSVKRIHTLHTHTQTFASEHIERNTLKQTRKNAPDQKASNFSLILLSLSLIFPPYSSYDAGVLFTCCMHKCFLNVPFHFLVPFVLLFLTFNCFSTKRPTAHHCWVHLQKQTKISEKNGSNNTKRGNRSFEIPWYLWGQVWSTWCHLDPLVRKCLLSTSCHNFSILECPRTNEGVRKKKKREVIREHPGKKMNRMWLWDNKTKGNSKGFVDRLCWCLICLIGRPSV